MTYKDCYERHILTDEIPNEPTFQFWETSNIRNVKVPGKVPHHEWNLLMLRNGYKVREGETVKTEYSFEDFDALIEEEVAKQKKREEKRKIREKKEAEEAEYERKVASGEIKLTPEEREKLDNKELRKAAKAA